MIATVLVISHVVVFAGGFIVAWVFGGRLRKELSRQVEDIKDSAEKVKEIGDILIHNK